ncbi:hypothetical protein ACGC1H_007371 [Rhizoctonia solani]|uniref:Gfd2/YDR514C-like C-terminal domain-containing protein n=1 Tax=Rhizoctonia solani TaxID=456999 RepID=A0A8H2WP23_9AGAM|nr:unnamed protein product [Rhizoctonia solani]
MSHKDNFQLVDVQGWDWDLHSVYSAYIGHFQSHGVPWYDRSWGHLFSSFDDFLTFGWPTVTLTDSRTGKGHIVTRAGSVGAFSKMVKTRFGETLPKISNMMQIIPYEHTQRHLRQIADMATYKKVHATLPAAEFSAYKSKIKHGDLHLIDKLWHSRDKSWLSIRFVWSEKSLLPLEWGYAAVRCAHINAAGSWPPKEENFRKGHFVVAEYADKVRNKLRPTHPWEYAFGDTHVVGKSKLPDIINSVIGSLATPDSESIANSLVLVGHNISGDLERLAELKIKLPHNMLIVDTAVASLRHAVFGPQLPPAAPLARLLAAQTRAPRCTLGNAGNDAWLALGAMIAMVDRNSIPLNTATVGGPLPSPIPYPPKAASPSGLPPINISGVRPRYNSQMRPSPNSPSPLPLPGTPPAEGFPFPSSGTNPNARPISAVFARPRTGSAGAEAMSRLSLNGLNLGSGPSLGFDPGMGIASNRSARPASTAFGTTTGQNARNSLNLGPTNVDEFGGTGGQIPISRSWNGKSVLGSGRPQTPLGLGGGLLDIKPGRSSKLVVSPSVKPSGEDSTEDESEAANESEDDQHRPSSKGRPVVA